MPNTTALDEIRQAVEDAGALASYIRDDQFRTAFQNQLASPIVRDGVSRASVIYAIGIAESFENDELDPVPPEKLHLMRRPLLLRSNLTPEASEALSWAYAHSMTGVMSHSRETSELYAQAKEALAEVFMYGHPLGDFIGLFEAAGTKALQWYRIALEKSLIALEESQAAGKELVRLRVSVRNNASTVEELEDILGSLDDLWVRSALGEASRRND